MHLDSGTYLSLTELNFAKLYAQACAISSFEELNLFFKVFVLSIVAAMRSCRCSLSKCALSKSILIQMILSE